MQKYRGSSLMRAGFIGTVLIALVIVVGLQPQQLWSMATSVRYQAVFAEAGGLAAGNQVKVSGVTVGTVSDVAL
ncbi:mammalian cell entry protein, partial [Mycobacterium sp. ITM-2017-0098]